MKQILSCIGLSPAGIIERLFGSLEGDRAVLDENQDTVAPPIVWINEGRSIYNRVLYFVGRVISLTSLYVPREHKNRLQQVL